MPELFAGRVVLVVEDEYVLASDLTHWLQEAGATVLGPAGDVEAALDLLAQASTIDAAVLDIQLRDQKVFPVADALQARGIPFIFTTGYERSAIPDPYAGIVQCQKPVNAEMIRGALQRELRIEGRFPSVAKGKRLGSRD